MNMEKDLPKMFGELYYDKSVKFTIAFLTVIFILADFLFCADMANDNPANKSICFVFFNCMVIPFVIGTIYVFRYSVIYSSKDNAILVKFFGKKYQEISLFSITEVKGISLRGGALKIRTRNKSYFISLDCCNGHGLLEFLELYLPEDIFNI